MASATDLGRTLDSTTIDRDRETLIVEQINALRGLIATAKDEKIKLGAVAELNRMLAVGSYKAAVSNKQVNNFLGRGAAGASYVPSSVTKRLDAAAAAVAAVDATAEHADLLDSLEGDDGE